ncbi:MAG: asparagine synthase (glutamine-hydrolyzing), partial [Verrucomicrobiae bacterium]|nr:asparagine synthase (glutamine-hydrolyzing) [Verrucomicrobiae bacterium]
MCGIAGWVAAEGRQVEESVLRAMAGALAHRGPDEEGIWNGGRCGLAHRRLRVIDLSKNACQPMPNEDGRLQVVFNGEIYNFESLRAELVRRGHLFRSRSDTEVLIHGYEEWGPEIAGRLRGMFAVAIWDTRDQALFLARDRFGKKPLFLCRIGGGLAFGSELSVFSKVPGFTPTLRREAIRSYAEFGYFNAPETILEKVESLPPAHWALYGTDKWRLQRYWKVPIHRPAESRRVERAHLDDLEKTLQEAVACRLVSDVPLGCFLSGGVDSSLIAALAQNALGGKLKTYTVGFAGSPESEASHAAAVARHLNTDHQTLTLDATELLAEFELVLGQFSEPLGDDSLVPSFFICRETRRHVTVVLTGDGGDELFGGYDKYGQFAAACRIPPALRRLAGPLSKGPWPDRTQKSLEAFSRPTNEAVARWLSTLWKWSELPSLLTSKFRQAEPADRFHASWHEGVGVSELERFMKTDMETYLGGDILTKLDRASMAVGLEARSPLLDHVFAELVVREVPPIPGKPVLKQLLSRHLPRELFERPKSGFGMPVASWYRGPLKGVLERYTERDRLRRRGIFQPAAVAEAVAAHLSGRRNFGRKLHSIVA